MLFFHIRSLASFLRYFPVVSVAYLYWDMSRVWIQMDVNGEREVVEVELMGKMMVLG